MVKPIDGKPQRQDARGSSIAPGCNVLDLRTWQHEHLASAVIPDRRRFFSMGQSSSRRAARFIPAVPCAASASAARMLLLTCLALGTWLADGLPFRAHSATTVQEGSEPFQKLLHQADKAGPKEACRLLHKAIVLLKEEILPPEDANKFSRKFAQVLARAARNPKEVTDILGPRKRVARQLFYRRYREQWIYEQPLSLCVVFDCVKGKDPAVLTVQPLPTGND